MSGHFSNKRVRRDEDDEERVDVFARLRGMQANYYKNRAHTSNMLRGAPAPATANLGSSPGTGLNYRSSVKFNLSTIINFILSEVKVLDTQNNSPLNMYAINLAYVDGQPIRLDYPKTIQVSKLFGLDTFLTYFQACFGVPFASTAPTHSKRYPNMRTAVTIDNKVSATTTKPPLNFLEQFYFRQMTCLFFNQLFDISLSCCACYPQNESERMAWQVGIFKNCYSEQCRSYLNTNPFYYDALYVGPCSNNISQVSINYMRILALKNVNVNVNIQQLIEDYVAKNASA